MFLDFRYKRFIVLILKFIIGEDKICFFLNEDLYCNGLFVLGILYMYDFVNLNKLFIVFCKWLDKYMWDMFLFWKMFSIIILKEDVI